MRIKNLIDEDLVNYSKPSMFIITPQCNFKCDKECGKPVCQNSELAQAPIIEIDDVELAQRFYENSITEAITFGGLEPCDSFDEVWEFLRVIATLYMVSYDIQQAPDIIIYTGYYPSEIRSELKVLTELFNSYIYNIIIKFGRFIPDRPHRTDPILGVELASDNQFSVNLGEMRERGLDFESYFAELTGKEIYYRNLVRDTTKVNKELT